MLNRRGFHRNPDVRWEQVSNTPNAKVVYAEAQQTGTNFALSKRELPINRNSGLFAHKICPSFQSSRHLWTQTYPWNPVETPGPSHSSLKLIDTSEQFCTGRPYSSPIDTYIIFTGCLERSNTAAWSRQNYITIAPITPKTNNGGGRMPLWYCYFRFRRTIFSVCFLSQPSSPSVRSSVPTDCSVMKPVCTVCGCSQRWTHWPTVLHLHLLHHHHHVGKFSLIWYLCFIIVYYNVVAAFQLDHLKQTWLPYHELVPAWFAAGLQALTS